MGTVYEADCPKCGYRGEFHIGSGLFALQLHRHLRFFDEKEQEEIQKLETENRIQKFQITNQLSFCKFFWLQGQIRKDIYLETIAVTAIVSWFYMGSRKWDMYCVRAVRNRS